jgi:hypothetical protein
MSYTYSRGVVDLQFLLFDAPDSVYHVHDKGYKWLFQKPQVLIGFLCDFMELPVDATVIEVLSLDTEHILPDWKGLRSDRVFRIILEVCGVRREWLVLLEFQRDQDTMMDVRFLEYELLAILSKANAWRGMIEKAGHVTELRLPSVTRILLYNGQLPWQVWKDRPLVKQDVAERWNDLPELRVHKVHQVDVHRMDSNELASKTSGISKVFWMDQVLDVDYEETINRLRELSARLGPVPDEEYKAFMGWLNVRLQISVPKLLEKIAEVFEQMKRGEEGKVAEVVEVYYEKKFREVREQALLEGKLEGKLEGRLEEQLEVAKRLIAEGQFTVEKIAGLSGLTVDHVRGLMLN